MTTTRVSPNESDLDDLRVIYGRGTTFWAPEERLQIDEGRWLAQTGAPSTVLNAALCYGKHGGRQLQPTIDEVTASKTRIAINVAGQTLGAIQPLMQAGWICVGSLPFMVAGLGQLADAQDGADVPDIRELTLEELPAARGLIEDSFGLTDDLSVVAIPDKVATTAGHAAWGLFTEAGMVSCMGTTRVDDTLIVWSMATPTQHRRHGYGRQLLLGALAGGSAEGATRCLLSGSSQGAGMYRSVGFEVLEWWQVWSRPRWVLALD